MKRMRILLLGSGGQLGWEVHRQLFCLGDVFAYDYPQIDLTKPNEIVKLIQNDKPDLIYNATAYTAVDRAESDEKNARMVNATTPGEIAENCQKRGIGLIHVSTDYVFDGQKGGDYVEMDKPNPLNVYGKTKYEGEEYISQSGCMHLIFRTSWVYSRRKGGFLEKVFDWARTNRELRIVVDQIGNPTWARMLAVLTTSTIMPKGQESITGFFEQHHGLYHLGGKGAVSRFEFTKAIIDFLPESDPLRQTRILTAMTVDFPSPAERPAHSALNCDKFEKDFGIQIPAWHESLQLSLIS